MDRISTWARKHLRESFHALQLSSLSPDQSEHLLSELLNIPELPADLRLQILERASGIPLYLEEILRMLIDRGALERQDGRWKLASGEETLGVPETLQGLILARFDRLDPVSRKALQTAAVIGHHFTKELLIAVLAQASPLAVRPEDVQAGLGRLVEKDFIHPALGGQPDEDFSFRHVLVSDAIYSTLLKRERGHLHGQVGTALEVLYASRLDDQVELLARHYAWSDQPDRALHFLILAGQKAARRYANEAAQQHFEAALSLLETTAHLPGQERQVHIGLGDLLVLAGEYPAAREHYEAAERATPTEVAGEDLIGRCELFRRIATTFERQGEYEPALQRLGQAEELLEEAQQFLPVEYARVYNDIGWIHFRRGSLEAAESFLLKALSQIENVQQVDLAASIYNRLGGVCFQKDQLDQASQWVRKSLALREEIGDVVAVARSYNNLGLLDWKRGDWEGALGDFTRSVELHANLGDVEGMVNVHGNLGLLQLDRGNVAAAYHHLETALGTAQSAGNMYHMGVISLHLSRLYVATRDWPQALECGHHSIEILKEIGSEDS
jgi:predicted ATPase